MSAVEGGGHAVGFHLLFERPLPARQVPEVYNGIVSWLQSEKAKVKSEQPPVRIEAAHGKARQMMGWRKDAKKKMVFELAQAGPVAWVRVMVFPAAQNASDVRMRQEEARANWGELLAELWVRLGDAGAMQEAILTPGTDWAAKAHEGRRMMMAGAGFIVLGLVLTAVVFLASSGQGIFFIGFLVIGALMLMYGWMNARGAKGRMEKQQRALQHMTQPPPQ